MADANFAAALVVLVVASISFFGIGMMTAVLPLISPEKGAQLGFIAQGMLLVVSGVYYPVSVLPDVDAVAVDDLAGDLRAATASATRSSTAPASPWGEHLAAAR